MNCISFCSDLISVENVSVVINHARLESFAFILVLTSCRFNMCVGHQLWCSVYLLSNHQKMTCAAWIPLCVPTQELLGIFCFIASKIRPNSIHSFCLIPFYFILDCCVSALFRWWAFWLRLFGPVVATRNFTPSLKFLKRNLKQCYESM